MRKWTWSVASVCALLSTQTWAQAGYWVAYEKNSFSAYEVDLDSIRHQDDLLAFRYRERYGEGSRSPEIPALVHCGLRQRSDVDSAGRYDLRPVFPGSRMAAQLDKVCSMADSLNSGVGLDPLQAAKNKALSSSPPVKIGDATPMIQVTTVTPTPVTTIATDPLEGLTPEDINVLWEEAIYRDDGFEWDYTITRFRTEPEARYCRNNLLHCTALLSAEKVNQARTMDLPDWLRTTFRRPLGQRFSEPVLDPRTNEWVLVSLQARREVPFNQDADKRTWMRRYAAEVLPSAEQVRNNPESRKRRILTQLRSKADLDHVLKDSLLTRQDLDKPGTLGLTALTVAVNDGLPELARALVEQGASPTACADHYNPMAAALHKHDWNSVNWLRSLGVGFQGCDGDPPLLMQAAAWNAPGVIDHLLAQGEDPLQTFDLIRGSERLRWSWAKFVPETAPQLDKVYAHMAAHPSRAKAPVWDAWIEQGGKRFEFKDGRSITLERSPFVLLSQRRSPGILCLATSLKPELHDWSDVSTFRRRLSSGHLLRWVGPNISLPVAHLTLREGWRLMSGASLCTDSGTGTTRSTVTDVQGPEGRSVPLQQLWLEKKPLHLVVAFRHDSGEGEDLLGLRRVTLLFK